MSPNCQLGTGLQSETKQNCGRPALSVSTNHVLVSILSCSFAFLQGFKYLLETPTKHLVLTTISKSRSNLLYYNGGHAPSAWKGVSHHVNPVAQNNPLIKMNGPNGVLVNKSSGFGL